MVKYLPEGQLISTPENRQYISSESGLEMAKSEGRILESMALMCDGELNISVDLFGMKGIIPKNEAVYGETQKDIAIITRIGKPVCFKVLGFQTDKEGNRYALLSRRSAQAECMRNFVSTLENGDIIDAKVTHMERFGAFVDIGCGIISLLSIDCISVSRITHPKDRFSVGSCIKAVVKSIDRESGRVYVSHKELLGTWEENAATFSIGQTVAGIIRSIEDYGVFIELTPNLTGLAEAREGLEVGQCAAVYIKNIIPERMKVKLVIIDSGRECEIRKSTKYYLDGESHIDRWVYSPKCCTKVIESVF